MRISIHDDISKLGKHARAQIEAALRAPVKRTVKLPITTKSNKKPAEQATDSKKKKRPSRVVKCLETGLRYCPYPSPDPSAWLHTALNQRYGSHDEGGDHAHEVIIPGHETRFRWDHIVYGVICIELDGYGYHFDLKSFKRDREKQKHGLVNGFIVYRVTAQDVRENLNGVLDNVDAMLAHHEKYKMTLSPIGKTQYMLDKREKILNDNKQSIPRCFY